jgi:phosphoribosylanthranilate isomerase
LFVNPSLDDVRRVFDAGLVDVAQLHGDEDAAFCTATGVPFWKAIRVANADDLDRLRAFGGELAVIDAASERFGGSGKQVPLDLGRRAAAMRPVLLAGGLTPENVADVVREVRPFGVDVASGVESAPGVKDAARVRAFVAAARSAS